MKRHWRRWLALLVVVLLAVVFGLRWYLSSYLMKARVTAQLEALYGGRLSVDSVDIGLNRSVLTGVKLYEDGHGPDQPPWLSIDRLEADISLADLRDGRQPKAVRVQGVTITLRFDDQGLLITALPPRPSAAPLPLDTLPAVELSEGRLILLGTRERQQRVDNIAASIHGTGSRHDIEATGRSSVGSWTAGGAIDLSEKDLTITMRSDGDVKVTQPLLESLPFVAASAWNEVQTAGTTPVHVTLDYDWGLNRQALLVLLEPKDAMIHVTTVDLTTTDTVGKVEISNGKIKLTNMRGAGYGGTLAADADIDFRGDAVQVDLSKLMAENLDVRQLPPSWSLPPQLTGRLDAKAALDIVSTPGKPHIQGKGQGIIRDTCIAGQPTDGPINLELKDLQAGAQLSVQGRLISTALSPLARAFDLQLPPGTSGKLVLDVQADLPVETINDYQSFRATGKATLDDARLAGLPVSHAVADLNYAKGALAIDNVRASFQPQGLMTGRSSLRLEKPYRFEVHLEPEGVDLGLLAELEETLRPTVQIRGQASGSVAIEGTLKPWVAMSTGQAAIKALDVQGWNIAAASLRWRSEKDQVILTDIAAKGYGGNIKGTGTLPLKTGAPGKLELQYQDIELRQLTHEHFTVPVTVDGKVEGTLRGNFSSDPNDIDLVLEASALRVLLNRVPAEDIGTTLRYRQGFLDYRADGRTLGGSFQLSGDVAMNDRMAATRPQVGHLRFERVDIGRLPAIWDPVGATRNVSGAMDVDLEYRHDGPDRFPIGKGRAVVTDLSWKEQALANHVQGEVALTREELTLQELSSTLAQGTVAGKVVVNLRQPERSWFRFNLEDAQASELLQAWPSLAQELQGTLTIHSRCTLGYQWLGSAEVVLTRGKVSGVEVTEWRLPLRYTFEPASGDAQVDITDSIAMVAQGRVTGQLHAAWADGLRLNGKMSFVGVDLHQAVPTAKVGNGRATGHLEFHGDRVQSVDDIQGSLVASMQQTQALEVPFLKPLAPLLGTPTTATFQTGDVRARLGRGVIHIEQMSFPEGPLELYAEGEVTLQGRVDMNVTANTGRFSNLAATLGFRLPQTGIIAGDLVRRATALLSPSLVHIHVGGTVHEPRVQVIPLPVLTENALRFFAGMR
jgi:hypothetical protein